MYHIFFIHSSVDGCSIYCLLWIVLQWTLGCLCLFEWLQHVSDWSFFVSRYPENHLIPCMTYRSQNTRYLFISLQWFRPNSRIKSKFHHFHANSSKSHPSIFLYHPSFLPLFPLSFLSLPHPLPLPCAPFSSGRLSRYILIIITHKHVCVFKADIYKIQSENSLSYSSTHTPKLPPLR